MDILSFNKQIKDLIEKDNIPGAIGLLKKLLDSSPLLDEAIIYSARYSEIVKEIRIGTIDFEKGKIEKNRIRYAILELLRDIEEKSNSDIDIRCELLNLNIPNDEISLILKQKHSGTGDNIGKDKILGDKIEGDKVVTYNINKTNNSRILIILLTFIGISSICYYYFYEYNTVQPFRIMYHTLDDNAIDYVMNNEIPTELNIELGGENILLGNSVLKYLTELKKKYSFTFEENEGDLSIGFKTEDSLGINSDYNVEDVSKFRKGGNKIIKKFLVSTVDELTYSKKVLSIEEALTFFDSNKNCYNYIKNQKYYYENQDVNCESYANRNLMNLHFRLLENESDYNSDKFMMFLRDITSKNLPEKLLPYSLYCFCDSRGACGGYECIDGDTIKGYTVDLKFPIIKLKIASLQNISDKPITIDWLKIAEVGDKYKSYLRDSSFNKGLLDKENIVKIEGEEIFPPRVLKPNEKIIIPINFYLETTEGLKYIFGPSFKIVDMCINNKSYAFREEKPRRFSLYVVNAIGSCPYVYTTCNNKINWISQGTFITGQNNKMKDLMDTIPLSCFSGSLLIKEKEDEESQIDYISVIQKSNNGEIKIFHPMNKLLNSLDSKYMTLKKGDTIELQFPEFVTSNSNDKYKYFLISKGYYIPLNSVVSDSKINKNKRIPLGK